MDKRVSTTKTQKCPILGFTGQRTDWSITKSGGSSVFWALTISLTTIFGLGFHYAALYPKPNVIVNGYDRTLNWPYFGFDPVQVLLLHGLSITGAFTFLNKINNYFIDGCNIIIPESFSLWHCMSMRGRLQSMIGFCTLVTKCVHQH